MIFPPQGPQVPRPIVPVVELSELEAAVASEAEVDGKVDAHKVVTTGIHGVGASTVESASGSQAKVDAHKAIATGIHGIEDYRAHKRILLNPYVPKANSYKGQLHTHTTNSDGVDTPAALETAYKNAGYNFVVITDHNFLTPDPGVADILHISGVEESGIGAHINSFPRTAETAKTALQGIINDIEDDSGLACPAHPDLNIALITEETLLTLYDYQLVEIYNAHVAQNSEDKWDTILTAHKPIFGTAVDDCHDIAGAAFNKGFVVVNADSPTQADIIEALNSGNFYCQQTGAPTLSVSVSGNVITVTANMSSNIRFIGKRGKSLKYEAGVTTSSYTVKGNERYVRIRAIDAATGTKYSWSQPIFIKILEGLFGDVIYIPRGQKNETNLLDNGNFEVGDPPIRWTALQATQARENTIIKLGSHSAKVTVTVDPSGIIYQELANYAQYKGRKVTLGAWVYATTIDALVRLYDGVDYSFSPDHPGDSTWRWMTITRTVDSSATMLRADLRVRVLGTIAYFDGAVLVEGDNCPAFSPKPDQALINHHTADYAMSAFETGFVLHTNLGAGTTITITLPQTVPAGFTCRFAVMAAQELRIDPGAAGAIYIDGAKQSDDKYISADDEAESVVLTADGNGDWIASSVVGTWTVE